jgi:ABC-type transport system substrate-binding protein
VRPQTAGAYATLLAEPSSRTDVDAFLRAQTTDVADPLQVYARFTSRARGGKEAGDIPGFDAGLYDEVYSRAAAEADRGPRLQLVDQLQKMVVAAYVDIPLYEQRSVVAERVRVTGAPAGFVRMATPWAALIGAAA